MKFLIKDNPISYDEIYQAIRSYITESHGKRPSYMLVHPETRRNIMISSGDEMRGVSYEVVQLTHPNKDEGIQAVHTVFGLYLLQSFEVEPGFMILCG